MEAPILLSVRSRSWRTVEKDWRNSPGFEESRRDHQGSARVDREARRLVSCTVMDYSERITIEPGKRGGKPCIRGLRITVYEVLEYLASGMSEDEILRDFPDLESEDVRACLAFAADRERKFSSVPAS